MIDEKIDKQNVEDIMGLTSMQEGMLFHYLSKPDSFQYREQFRFKLEGKIDTELFIKAWNIVVRQNEILRAVIRWEKLEEPVQVILKNKELPVRVIYLDNNTNKTLSSDLEKIIETDRKEPVHLSREPIRISLIITGDSSADMLITFHHILYDGWSNGIVLKEFFDIYNQLSANQEIFDTGIPPKTKYKEFIKWYKSNESKNREEHEQTWKKYLEGFDTLTVLPYDINKPGEIETVATYSLELDRDFKEKIDSCCKSLNITFSAIIYTAWGILLQKYNNSNDIIFGTTVSGRTPELNGVESIAGLFINTIPFRLHTSTDCLISEILKTTANHLKERNNLEHCSLTNIKKWVGFGSETSLFDSIIVIDNYPLIGLDSRDCTLRFLSFETFEMTNFDLTIQVMLSKTVETPVIFDFHYNADVFKKETIKRIASHFENILSGMVTDSSCLISTVPFLNENEMKQILLEFNRLEIQYVVDKTIHGVIEEQSLRTPLNRAVQFEDRWLNYLEFNKEANRLAHLLIASGATSGTRIALMMPRSIDMIVGVYAILKAGGVCVPLDISYPVERNGFIIEDSEALFLLKTPSVAFSPSSLPGFTREVKDVLYQAGTLDNYSDQDPGVSVKAEDLSYIIYTSGSTGKPKGALLHHSGIVNHTYTKIDVLGITEADSVGINFSINVIASVWQMLSPLFMGARLVVYTDEVEWDPYLQFKKVSEDGVTVIEVIPPVLKSFLFLLDDGKERINLGKLRKIALTSEETKPYVVNKFYTAYPLGTDLVDCYGQTECCDDILHYTIPVDTHTQVVPIGTPSLNTQVIVLNHHNQLQPVGVPGEICASGAGVCYGYWNRKELTDEKFVSNPLNPSIRMYRTGDLGRWRSDGCVEYLGRLDHQVKIRGNRVELREIENYVLRYPSIREAAVVAKEDKDGEKNLYAFFVSDRVLTSPEIRQYLLKTLPDYMVPAHFVPMEKLPLTPNGKIDRKLLVKMEVEEVTGIGVEFQAPRNSYEIKLQGIWKQLLEVDRIGINDNFFDLGGHSLQLIKLKSKLEKGFDLSREVSVIELFNHPTIAHQARFIEENLKGKEQEKNLTSNYSGKGVNSIHSGNRFSKRFLDDEGKEVLQSNDVAVIGIAFKVPGASNVNEFWDIIIKGVETVSFFSEEELETSEGYKVIEGYSTLVPAGGVMGGIEYFDAEFFGYHPREAQLMDPQQRVFLEHSWMALEDAGYIGSEYPGSVGVYAGVGWNTYLLNNVLRNPGIIKAMGEFQTMIGNDKDFFATRVSYKLNLSGPGVTIQTACSTSLVAIHTAVQSLLNRECDIALAGGSAIKIPERTGYFYTQGGHMSPDGHCRSFDANAQGTVFGNGVGVVVLKRLDEAVRDNDHIYAVVKGSAINNDGSLKVGYTSPGEQGQCDVILKALREAQVSPRSIGYVEAHGTGTVLGDPVEVSAITRAYNSVLTDEADCKDDRGYCALGSVKANVGHLDVAAGVTGFIKVVLCLYHKQIPPSINVSVPNPLLDLGNSPFYINCEAKEWGANETIPRRAAVSSLGIGGTNAHVILEEAPQVEELSPVRPWNILVFSARTEGALDRRIDQFYSYVKKNPGVSVSDAAYTLHVGRVPFSYRKMLVCPDSGDLVELLPGIKSAAPSFVEEGNKPVIFMFPGQGAQYVDMGRELYRTIPFFREEIDRCLEIIKPFFSYNLKDILYPIQDKDNNIEGQHQSKSFSGDQGGTLRSGDNFVQKNKALDNVEFNLTPDRMALHTGGQKSSLVNETGIAQPLLFIFEYALSRLLMKWGIQPYAMIGHSIGEYTAACLSGGLELEDALKLVVLRGKLMQQMPTGDMLSVPMSEKDLTPLLDEILNVPFSKPGESLSLAAVNSQSLCVVSGTHHAIEAFQIKLKEHGIESSILHTSHAFHSAMMDPILKPFEDAVADVSIHSPRIPYISNLTGDWVTVGEIKSPGYWSGHLRNTVRFAGGIEKLLEIESPVFIEVGPGSVLSTFVKQQSEAVKRTPAGIVHLVRHPKKDVPDTAYLYQSIGQLWLSGVFIDWKGFYEGEKRRRISLPSYSFERIAHWLDSDSESPVEKEPEAVKNKIDNWFYTPSWKQALPSVLTTVEIEKSIAQSRCLLIFIDEPGLSVGCWETLIHLFREKKHDVTLVKPGEFFEKVTENMYCINPSNPDHYNSLFEYIGEQDKTIDTIVHTWMSSFELPVDYLERGVYSLLFLVKAMAGQSMFHSIDLWVVSSGLHQVEKEDRCFPEKATLIGPVNVISQEYPNIVCRSIDIHPDDPQDEIAQNLYHEIISSQVDRFIAFRGVQRWIQTFEPFTLSPMDTVPAMLRENGTYLITGGLGKIGFVFAKYLAQTVRARLILTQRSPFPSREEWENLEKNTSNPISLKIMEIKQIEAAGGSVLVIPADVSNIEEMKEVFKLAHETFGPVHGVIHAAGAMENEHFKPISHLETNNCQVHFNPKIRGVYVLEELLRDEHVDFVVFTSSLSSVLGGIGLYGYSAANGFMDAYAKKQSRETSTKYISIDWDEWDFGKKSGCTPKSNQACNTFYIKPEDGSELFNRVLHIMSIPRVVISCTSLEKRFKQWSAPQSVEKQQHLSQRPKGFENFDVPTSEAERLVAEIWQELLGMEQIGINDDFFTLGGHSLLATRLASRLREIFRVDIPIDIFFDRSTIRLLMEYIEEKWGGKETVEEIALTYREVQAMT